MYEISIHKTFHAAHAICLPDGVLESSHRHDWTVEVTVAARELDALDVVMDFHALEAIVDGVLAPWRGADLNAVAPFAGGAANRVNPTAERVAWWIGTQVAQALPPGVRLMGVRVGEAPGCAATYRP